MTGEQPGNPGADGETGPIGPGLRRRILCEDHPQPGQRIAGRYRIERFVGAGGMGDVFEATDERSHRRVALKLLRATAVPDVRSEDLERRVGLLERLEHPGLVRTLDAGQAGGFPFVVTEFLEGGTLRERIRRQGTIPAGDAVRLLDPVLRALAYLHGRGIVHRDVKPQNIVLSPDGAKLLDYGLARRLGIPLPESSAVEGTREYLPPEQARGAPQDHRADLYACSAVLYEMLCGRPPRDAAGTSLRFPADLRRTAPRALLAAVSVGLSPDPACRFGSADEMRAALVRSLGAPGSGPLRLGRWRARRRDADARTRFRKLPWLVAAALTLGGGAAWYQRSHDRIASLAVRGEEVVLKNPLGWELARWNLRAPVLATALLPNESRTRVLVAVAPEHSGLPGRLDAFLATSPAAPQPPVWSRSGGARLQTPIRLWPLLIRGRRPAVLVQWRGAPDAGDRFSTFDAEGVRLGEWDCPGARVTALRVVPGRPGRGSTVWVGTAARRPGAIPHVLGLSLPDLAVRRARVPARRGEVASIRVRGADLLVEVASRTHRSAGLAGPRSSGDLAESASSACAPAE